MGKLFSLFKGQDNDSSDLSDKDGSIDGDFTDSSVEPEGVRRVKIILPTDGWEEICNIDIDVLVDEMVEKKNEVRQTGSHKFEKNLKIPTTEENRDRLQRAYNFWLTYRPEKCEVFMPNWERILEKPVIEQSFLVEDYVNKINMLLELEELPDYDLPPNIPKEEILVRNPNQPGVYITLAEALKKQVDRPDIDRSVLKKTGSYHSKPSTSEMSEQCSENILTFPKKTYSHHTV